MSLYIGGRLVYLYMILYLYMIYIYHQFLGNNHSIIQVVSKKKNGSGACLNFKKRPVIVFKKK